MMKKDDGAVGIVKPKEKYVGCRILDSPTSLLHFPRYILTKEFQATWLVICKRIASRNGKPCLKDLALNLAAKHKGSEVSKGAIERPIRLLIQIFTEQ